MEIKQLKTSLLKSVCLLLSACCLLIGQVQAASTVSFYHQDALGSNIATTDENGDIVWNEEYQPYGEKIFELGKDATTENQDWFTGKNYDEDLDLTYFGARWYDAKQGRFLSIDPAPVQPGNIHSFNRYVYATNNPYKYVDPDGRAIETVFDVLSFGISVGFLIDEPNLDNAAGAAIDGLAIFVPFVPGGAGVLRTASKTPAQLGKEGEEVASAITGTKKIRRCFR